MCSILIWAQDKDDLSPVLCSKNGNDLDSHNQEIMKTLSNAAIEVGKLKAKKNRLNSGEIEGSRFIFTKNMNALFIDVDSVRRDSIGRIMHISCLSKHCMKGNHEHHVSLAVDSISYWAKTHDWPIRNGVLNRCKEEINLCANAHNHNSCIPTFLKAWKWFNDFFKS